jgi:hypothetical protein
MGFSYKGTEQKHRREEITEGVTVYKDFGLDVGLGEHVVMKISWKTGAWGR